MFTDRDLYEVSDDSRCTECNRMWWNCVCEKRKAKMCDNERIEYEVDEIRSAERTEDE